MTKDLNEPLTMELTFTMDEWADIGSMLMTIAADIAQEVLHAGDAEKRARGRVMVHRAHSIAETIKAKWHEANNAG